MPPRVSILIPNFNNGRQSSKSGADDLLGNLLRSLLEMLRGETTAFEIIAYDDGSTDDSLATLREWAGKRWPAGGVNAGKPFLELIEAEHCGYLSRVANVLSRRARGEVLVRLDGDIVCLTPNFATRLCAVFDEGPDRLGVIAPKQLRPDGRIHAYGDFVLHPNGYAHVASGMPRDAVKHPMQVDHAMGCFHVMKREVFESVGGYDENFLRGQTEDLGLRALLQGWTCLAVPHVEFVHFHTMRLERATEADTDEGLAKTFRVFEDKWGFSRLAPDLDEIRRRYAGTPLLWNPRWFGREPRLTDTRPGPIKIESSEWARFATDEKLQGAVHARTGVILDVIKQTGVPRRATVLGAGEGLTSHVLAIRGLPTQNFDWQSANVELARRCVANRKYPGGPPRFEAMPDVRRIPLEDGAADMLIVFDLLEKHPNPVALLREAERVLEPGKLLVIFSQRPDPVPVDPSDPKLQNESCPEHRYLWLELLNQVHALRAWDFRIDPKKDYKSREMIVAATRVPAVSELAGAGAGGGASLRAGR